MAEQPMKALFPDDDAQTNEARISFCKDVECIKLLIPSSAHVGGHLNADGEHEGLGEDEDEGEGDDASLGGGDENEGDIEDMEEEELQTDFLVIN
jgi:hypothetical protein